MDSSRQSRGLSGWARSLVASRRRPASPRRRARFAPEVQGLEERRVLSYMAPVSYGVGTSPAGVAIGDFNGDAIPDLAVANQAAAGTVSLLLGNGNRTFAPAAAIPAGANPTDLRAADFNADGKADLAVVGAGVVNLLMGHGDGTFGAPTAFAVGSGSHSLNVGDFDGDGNVDVATMNYGTASVLLGRGDGTFAPRLDAAIPGNSTNTVVGDFNGDGRLDLATSNTMSLGTVTVLSGRGDGTFDPAASSYAYSAPVYLAAGDFNEDGYDDFAVANSYAATSMSVLMNNGDGTYAAPTTYSIGETGYEIESGDFNGDGHDDFAVRGASKYMVQLGKGDGSFYPAVNYPLPAGRFEMGASGDLDGDGAIDFAYPSTGGVTVLMNAADDRANLAGAVALDAVVPASTTAGSSLPMTITALDADGHIATGFRGTLFVTTDDPVPSTLAYTFTAADAGVHTFGASVKLTTQGARTVTVAAPFLGSVSRSVTVTPGVTAFGIAAPAGSNAGETFQLTVRALDALGDVGTGYSSTVHFTSTDPQAVLPADYTFAPEDAGVHTFNVTLKSSGSRYVGVSEAGGTARGGSFVNVTPGAATSFALAGGSGAVGVARPVTIVARDAYGNTDPTYAGTVHVTSSDPAALLPADATLAGGIGTVGVTLYTVGTQTITATDVANPALFGNVSSDATPPIAARFAVSGYPNTTAGATNTFTVTVRDTIGQVATGYTGTVIFSSSDVQAGLPASYTFTAADAGVHTFGATLRTAGTQAISLRDGSGLLTGTQPGITVVAAAFAGYRLSVPLGTDSQGHMLVTAGNTIPLTVRAVDAYGNTVPSYRGKTHFTSTDAQAALPADYGFTTSDAGVHTFPVALKTVTPNSVVWSFSVADASSAATLATLTNFEVTNAAAARFVLNAPSNATPGLPFSVKVTVYDAYGNKVKNYFGTVHFTSTAGTTGLPADYTFNADDAGTHDFTVLFTVAADTTLTVVDVSNPAITASSLIRVKSSGGGGGGGGGGGKKA